MAPPRACGYSTWRCGAGPGGRPTTSQAFLTTVLFYASISLTAWLVLLVPLFTDRSRTLHDILAGTIVLRRTRLRASAS